MGTSRISQREIDALLDSQKLRQTGPYLGAGKPLNCVCLVCGKTVTPRLSSIKNGHKGCKFCAAQARSLLRKVPDEQAKKLMIEAGVEPIEPYKSSSSPWLCQCLKCGEKVTPQFQNVKNGHKACKYCSGKAVTQEAAISIYLSSGAKPIGPFIRTDLRWEGNCFGCNSEVSPRLDDLKQGQGACRKCGIEISSSKQRLSERVAIQRMLDAGAEPLEPWGSKKIDDPWISRCLNCDATITPSVHSVSNGQGPCVHCGHRTASEKNMFTQDHAKNLLEKYGFEAVGLYVGAGVPWLTKCKACGSEKSRRLANIQKGHSCQECAYQGSKVSQEDAIEAMRSRGWEPLEPYVRGSDPWRCLCLNCGEKGFKRLYSLEHDRVMGCFYCGERTLGSIFYFIHNKELGAFKVGVGKSRRLDDHRGKGWNLIHQWDLGSPTPAYLLEDKVLTFIREEWGLPQWLSNQDMPQKGATETFSDSEYSQIEVYHLIEKLKVFN